MDGRICGHGDCLDIDNSMGCMSIKDEASRGEVRAIMGSVTRVYVVLPSPAPETEGTVGLPLHRRILRSELGTFIYWRWSYLYTCNGPSLTRRRMIELDHTCPIMTDLDH